MRCNPILRKLYRIRGLMLAPPIIVAFALRSGETERGCIVWPLGLVLFVAGLLLRIWAEMHIHYRLKVPTRLTTTGPYAYVRNPLYLANTAMICGMTALMEVLWMVPIALLWCYLLYSAVVKYEEFVLARKYGFRYLEYKRSTPRWLPRIPLASRIFDSRRHSCPHHIWSCIKVEVHSLLWLLLPVIKELLSRRSC